MNAEEGLGCVCAFGEYRQGADGFGVCGVCNDLLGEREVPGGEVEADLGGGRVAGGFGAGEFDADAAGGVVGDGGIGWSGGSDGVGVESEGDEILQAGGSADGVGVDGRGVCVLTKDGSDPVVPSGVGVVGAGFEGEGNGAGIGAAGEDAVVGHIRAIGGRRGVVGGAGEEEVDFFPAKAGSLLMCLR